MAAAVEPEESAVTDVLEKLSLATEPDGVVSYDGCKRFLDNEADARDMVDKIQGSAKCETIVLRGNSFGPAAAESLGRVLSKKKDLKKAILSDIFTKRGLDQLPLALKHLLSGITASDCRLHVLDLSDNAFGPVGAEEVGKFLSSPSAIELEEIILTNNGLGSSGGEIIAASLEKLLHNATEANAQPRLRRFVAGRNRLENKGATALAAVFEKFGTLEEVRLPQNGVTQDGIASLAKAFSKNPNLRIVDLCDNTFSEYGSEKMAETLPELRKLEILNFDDCLLKNKGAAAICEALRDGSDCLKEVRIGGNELTGDVCLGNRFGSKAIAEISARADELGISVGTFSEDEDASSYESSKSDIEDEMENIHSESSAESDVDIGTRKTEGATSTDEFITARDNISEGSRDVEVQSVEQESIESKHSVEQEGTESKQSDESVGTVEDETRILEFMVDVCYLPAKAVQRMREHRQLLLIPRSYLKSLTHQNLAMFAFGLGSISNDDLPEELREDVWELFDVCLQAGFQHPEKCSSFCNWLINFFCVEEHIAALPRDGVRAAFKMLERATRESYFCQTARTLFSFFLRAKPRLTDEDYIASFLNALESSCFTNGTLSAEEDKRLPPRCS